MYINLLEGNFIREGSSLQRNGETDTKMFCQHDGLLEKKQRKKSCRTAGGEHLVQRFAAVDEVSYSAVLTVKI
jgi:hypothetical protein